MEGKKQVDKN